MGRLQPNLLINFAVIGLLSVAAASCVTTKGTTSSKADKNDCSTWSEAKQKHLATDMIKQILADQDLTKSTNGDKPLLEVSDIKNSSGKTVDATGLQTSIYDEIINSGKLRLHKKPGKVELQPAEPSKPVAPDFTSNAEIKFAAGTYQLTFIFKSTTKTLSKTLSASAVCSI